MDQPVWGTAAPLLSSPLPARAEVVIVGGGITGVALLSALCRSGVDAVLLEREHLAAGASGRNAGFLLAGVAENYATAVRRYGRATAAEVWAFTLENHARVAAAAAPLDARYHARGSITAALDADEAAALEESATLLAEDGLPGAITVAEPVPGALCALLNPADGEIDPVRLVRGIAAAHADRVHQHSEAVAVIDGLNACTVQLRDHSIEAHAVVLATNAWTSTLLPSVAIAPVRAQMLASAPVPRLIGRPVYAEHGHRYWRQDDDGSVLVGGFRNRAIDEEVGYDTTPTRGVQEHLEAQLRLLGVSAGITHRWAGTMGFSADGLPLVGRLGDQSRIHLCAGYTGHGMGFAVHAAAVLVGNLLDHGAMPPWLDARRQARP